MIMNTNPNEVFIDKIIKYLTYFCINLRYVGNPQYLPVISCLSCMCI